MIVCASCGGDEKLMRSQEMWLCIHCEANEIVYGYPLLKNEPDECPFCYGSVDTELLPESHLFDDELREYLGEDDDRILYIHACAQCDDPECSSDGNYIAYGRRWYWNPEDGDFTAARPVVGMELIRVQNKAQEAAGQKRLPGFLDQ